MNFDLLITRAGDHYHAYAISAHSGDAEITFALPFAADALGPLARDSGVRRHAPPLQTLMAEPADLRELGSRLYNAIFRDEMRSVLVASQTEAAKHQEQLCIRLRFSHDAAHLATLPWEILFDPEQKHFLALSEKRPILRYLSLPRPRPALKVELPLSILAVLASPDDYVPLDVEREWQAMEKALANLREEEKVTLERLSAPTIKALQQRLLGDPVHVLHFVGHGLYAADQNEGLLIFADDRGGGREVSAEKLAPLLHNHAFLHLVYLNACEGAMVDGNNVFAGVAQTLVQGGVPAAIAMQDAITDDAAVDLSCTFYTALASGRSVDAALTQARVALHAAGNDEWVVPVLFSRSPDNRLFDVVDVLPEPDCPYPGMKPFAETQADAFFGREREISEAVGRLAKHPFLTVVGPSGSGKSSLVYAGILPALRQSPRFDGGEWDVKTVRPGDDPVAALAQALGTSSHDPAAFPPPQEGKSKQTLLIVDQFEETFTLAAANKEQRFVNILHTLIGQPHLYILLTVRADFYPEMMATGELWQDIRANRLELTPLGADGLWDAIVQPAAEVGVTVDEALAVALMADAVREAGALPLMQETLVLLWEKVERRRLDLDAYDKLADGDRSGLQVAIDQWADNVYNNELPAEARPIARRIFLRLIQFGRGRADTRRQQTVAELRASGDDPHLFDQTLRTLVDNRLLTTSGEVQEGGGQATEEASENADANAGTAVRRVDIAHEALIGGWGLLQEWIREKQEAESVRRRLVEEKTAEWVRLGRGGGGLLDEYELQEAAEWLSNAVHHDLGGSADLLALVEASRQAITQRKEAEEAARQRELEQAQALAEEESRRADAERQRAEAERQKGQAIARAAFGISLLLFIVAFIATVAYRNAQTALAKDASLSAGQSRQQYQVDPIASVYLAAYGLPNSANPRPYMPEAEFALTQGVRGIQETDYLTVTGSPFRQTQFAMAEDMLAVDGDDLYLVELSEPLTVGAVLSTSVASPVAKRGVDWGPDGLLLHFDSNQGMRLFDTNQCDPDCDEWPKPQPSPIAGPIGCAEWHPTDEQIAVCAGSLQILSTDWTTRAVDSLFTIDVKWSPDGKRLAAWGDDRDENFNHSRKLLVWDDANTISTTLPITDSISADLLWLPDNEHLLTIHEREIATDIFQKGIVVRSIKQWDQPAFVDATAYQGTARVHNATLSPDGRLLLLFLDNGVGQFWQIATDSASSMTLHYGGDLVGHTKSILSAAWHDEYLATTSMDGTIRIWRLDSEDSFTAVPISTLHGYPGTTFGDRADVFGARWLANQEDEDDQSLQLLTYGEDGSLRIWHVVDRQGSPICTGVDTDGVPRCIDENSKYETAGSQNSQRGITAMRVLDNGTVLTAGSDGSAGIGSLSAGEKLTMLAPPARMQAAQQATYQEYRVTWNEQGTHVLTHLVHDDALASLADNPFLNGVIRRVTPDGSMEFTSSVPGPITSTMWVGARVLVNGQSGPILLESVKSGETRSLPAFRSEVIAAQLSAQDRVATLERSGRLVIWDADFNQQLFVTSTQALAGGVSPTCNVLAWSADGTRLLSGGRQVMAWDLSSERGATANREGGAPAVLQGKQLDAALERDEQMRCVWLAPDNATAAFTHLDKFYVANVESGDVLWENDDHDEQIKGMAWTKGTVWSNQWSWPLNFLPKNGQNTRHLLLTWSVDGTARLWDVDQQSEIMRMSYQESPSRSGTPNAITAAAVSHDGIYILTATRAFLPIREEGGREIGGETGIIRRWRSWHQHPDCLLQEARTRTIRTLTDTQIEQYGLSPDVNTLSELKIDCPPQGTQSTLLTTSAVPIPHPIP